MSVLDHDLIVVMGDLNYRLDPGPLPPPTLGPDGELKDGEPVGVTTGYSATVSDERKAATPPPAGELRPPLPPLELSAEAGAGGAAAAAAFALRSGRERHRAVEAIVGAGQQRALLPYDQLSRTISAGLAFDEFGEGTLGFAPTYKYVPGTERYNTSRCPAFCDRVLWRLPHEQPRGGAVSVGEVEAVRYEAVPVRHSDHRPVVAMLRWTLPTFQPFEPFVDVVT